MQRWQQHFFLQTFKPDVVLNTGSAGGFLESLEVGTVVISDEVRHHDVDVTVFDYEHGQVPVNQQHTKRIQNLFNLL